MDIISLLIFLAIGAVAGWLAGLVTKGAGFGLLVDIVIGIIGAAIGGWLFGVLGVSVGGGLLGVILMATAGAVVLLVVLGLIRKAVR
jgi:uncharacterized membrane protein YeaQ/YmgE (transglycosylase-associated protein family)